MDNLTSELWMKFLGKQVRLIIEDGKFPAPRDGIFLDIDSTHIFLQVTRLKINDSGVEVTESVVKPYERRTIKRIESNGILWDSIKGGDNGNKDNSRKKN
jgi:hypothetical protein